MSLCVTRVCCFCLSLWHANSLTTINLLISYQVDHPQPQVIQLVNSAAASPSDSHSSSISKSAYFTAHFDFWDRLAHLLYPLIYLEPVSANCSLWLPRMQSLFGLNLQVLDYPMVEHLHDHCLWWYWWISSYWMICCIADRTFTVVFFQCLQNDWSEVL